MNRRELIEKYLDFFKTKSHKIIPNESLIPKNDPTVLFTTAGMHPLVPYLLGQKHPLGKRLANVQRCIRTQDIDEVGDSYHHTFFEMLGNWSLGDYFKKESIEYSFEFLTKILKIPKERLAITVFKGDKNAPKDEESAKIWISLGISNERLAFLEKEDNWWGPAGKSGPCGPDTEIFYWKPNNKPAPKKFDPKDKNWVEIWNNVFMQYIKNESGKYLTAKQKNVDTGMGVERTVTVLNGMEDDYLTDCFMPIIKRIEELSGVRYPKTKGDYEELSITKGLGKGLSLDDEIKAIRIIADHVKASALIIADGINPGNKEQGYVLRRLIRRAIIYGRKIGLENKGFFISKLAEPVFKIYSDYEELITNKETITKTLLEEENKFNGTLIKGLEVLKEIINTKKEFSGKDSFLLYQSYGFPFEMTIEMLKEKKVNINVDKLKKEFEREQSNHQKLSRTSADGRFKSGLADKSLETTRLHTATHLLNAALKMVLKDQNIHQKGSNITPERLRFDFNFDRKLNEDEIKKIEEVINKKIKENLKVIKEEMPFKEAKKLGAEAEFGTKYPEIVSVYTILDPSEKRGFFSKEICTGPHVNKIGEIGKFKIIKEESSSAGIRRIKAIVE